jgi:hypothetical protein
LFCADFSVRSLSKLHSLPAKPHTLVLCLVIQTGAAKISKIALEDEARRDMTKIVLAYKSWPRGQCSRARAAKKVRRAELRWRRRTDCWL